MARGYSQPRGWSIEARLAYSIRRGAVDECWEWIPGTRRYGEIEYGGTLYKAHRLVWILANGPISAGQVVMHRCDTPRCCNLAHLALGTQIDNIRDMCRKKRNRSRALVGEESRFSRLTSTQVLAIRADSRTRAEIATDYGVSTSAITLIKLRKNWKHLP